MIGRRILNITVLTIMVVSLLLGGMGQANAKVAPQHHMGHAPRYFSHPNYANSPLKLSDALVDLTGGGGTGATASAVVDPETGAITEIKVLTSGTGYTSSPTVNITTAFLTPTKPASAVAVVDYSGTVTAVEVTSAGAGYTAPEVTLNGGGGSGATAQASGGVDAITVTTGGTGYTQPIAEFSEPNLTEGTKPSANVQFDPETGAITGIEVVLPGSGYTSAPTVTIVDGADPTAPGPGVDATAAATMSIAKIDVVDFGTGYTSAPEVVISDPTGTGAVATASITTSGTGAVTAINVVDGGEGYVTKGIKKFVDGLPGLGEANANNLGQYLPVAVPDTESYPGSDYYEIGLVQYREQMHSDLPPTLLRGYVQISTEKVPGKHVQLTNAMLMGMMDMEIPGFYGVDEPHYLGPIIQATKDRPVRIKFYNLLPTGQSGDLFLPVDTTVMGAGMGPMMDGMLEHDPMNPMCGMTPKPMECYTENRATLHLHGGITPWISDGTAHQWITPAGETTAYPQGVSVVPVPDMANVDSGSETDGAMTFYYTNQQSARLLFYHDHSYGITRLNVYAGEAAGYLITDPMEQQLITDGILPADQIPLIVQDKTFVPSMRQLMETDELWDSHKWGGEGNLWLPHVYVPAQNPGDPSGANKYGRWAYGPWFWPPTNDVTYGPVENPYYDPSCDPDVQWCEPPLMPGVPYNSMGMEAFHDTPIVNGTAYPTVTLEPKAYRFRVLNAANDRFFNLSLYQADATGTEVALNAAEVEAALTDPYVVFPTPDETLSPKGPDWIQIGTEGGFLPSPVVIPAHPITWVNDPTVFNAGNVDLHSLLLGPAERADVVVDFSQFAGKTLILYNDAPAAFPARDPRYDYYTGSADLTEDGGVPTIQVGYGPNTRTVMQIKIADNPPARAYDLPRLVNAFKSTKLGGLGVFENSQHPTIVGQQGYNDAYGTSFKVNEGLVQIYDYSLTFRNLLGQSLTFPLEPKQIQDEMGEAFEHAYGRMSGFLGVETPRSQAGLQNMILYSYMHPPSEVLDAVELPQGASMQPVTTLDDGTQIWKITHNGVDTHPVHWHLYDVQLINRVGWDGIIRKPDPNELGWKDTVRVSPLEDTIVAIRPIVPTLPWDIPNSIRLLDPTMPEGAYLANSTAQEAAGLPIFAFAPNGEPIDIINHYVNFGWEYMWHCHILSHEEMDMMRSVVVGVAPKDPSNLTVTIRSGRAYLNWKDNSRNETAFIIERASDPTFTTGYARFELDPDTTQFVDNSIRSYRTYFYRMYATNVVGDTWDYSDPALNEGATFPTKAINSKLSNTVRVGTASVPATPSNLTGTPQSGPQVSLTWRDNATNETGFGVERCTGAGCTSFVQIAAPGPRTSVGNMTYVDTSVKAGTTYVYRVRALGSGGPSNYTSPVTVAVPALPPAPARASMSTAIVNTTTDRVTMSWSYTGTGATSFTIQRATNAQFTSGVTTYTASATARTWTQNTARRVTYYYRIRANTATGSSAWTNASPFPLKTP